MFFRSRQKSKFIQALSGQCEDKETRPGAMCHGEADFVAQWPGAYFSKVPKVFGHIWGDIILLVSSKRRRLEGRNFAAIFIFIAFKTHEKTNFTE